ncbi:uncharacterized protein EAE97_008305 [Botrytis byssoidea]|uniref:Uncharacterized protein n=1 Tax=Botrytis byssoidea TaxID=139641 RepID=A0A9P5IBM2_9HELO|nr:uncharacterized protein EAE97_008305 [Botrytis byssoidea]KAF7935398.1 hypothetical protein EAE97_008305 [Botrytis byssoidea]
MSSHRREKGKKRQTTEGAPSHGSPNRSSHHVRNTEVRDRQQNIVQPAPAPAPAPLLQHYTEGYDEVDNSPYYQGQYQKQDDVAAGPAPKSDAPPPVYQGSSFGTGAVSYAETTTTEASASSGNNFQDQNVPDTTSFKDIYEVAGLGYLKPQVENRSFTPNSSDYAMLPTHPNTPSRLTDTSAASYQDVMTRFPASVFTYKEQGELPYGVDDYPANWNSGDDPSFKSEGQGPVADLWAGVYRTEEEMGICCLFDHVDFYRLMYIITTLSSTVDCIQDNQTCVRMATEILNSAGRPYGFNIVSHLRPKGGFTVEQVGGLLRIMSDRSNKNRAAAVGRINGWLKINNSRVQEREKQKIREREEQARKSKDNKKHRKSSKHKSPSPTSSTPKPYPYWSPKKLVAGLPEAIMRYFNYDYQTAVADKRLCWHWRIDYFLYREKGDGDRLIWHLPQTFISPPPVPPEAHFWTNITAEQAEYDHQEYIQNDPEELNFAGKRLERLGWGESSIQEAEGLALEEERWRRKQEKGKSANVITVKPGVSSSKHPHPETNSSDSQKHTTRVQYMGKDGKIHYKRGTQ